MCLQISSSTDFAISSLTKREADPTSSMDSMCSVPLKRRRLSDSKAVKTEWTPSAFPKPTGDFIDLTVDSDDDNEAECVDLDDDFMSIDRHSSPMPLFTPDPTPRPRRLSGRKRTPSGIVFSSSSHFTSLSSLSSARNVDHGCIVDPSPSPKKARPASVSQVYHYNS
jgi:hypothetical protein